MLTHFHCLLSDLLGVCRHMHLLEASIFGLSHSSLLRFSYVEKLDTAWKQPRLLLSRVGCLLPKHKKVVVSKFIISVNGED